MLQTTTNGVGHHHHHHAGVLPRDIRNRDDFVGVSIFKTSGNAMSLRFSIAKALLDRIGKFKQVSIKGTPENGYLIAAGTDVKPYLTGLTRYYVCIAVDKVNAPRGLRQNVWLRAEIEGSRLRIPPLPPAWISGDPEFLPGTLCEETDRNMQLGKTPGDDAVRLSSSSAPIADAQQPQPQPQPTVAAVAALAGYTLPDNVGMADAQALLGRKLDEARAILRALETRTGLRMTLTRNFQITLDLSGK